MIVELEWMEAEKLQPAFPTFRLLIAHVVGKAG